MPISSNAYVEITSVVGGASALSARKLQLRIITTNELVPTGSTLSFVDAESVLSHFNSSNAEEYKQALQYFSHVDKNGNTPNSIQFARWADSDTSAQVFGTQVVPLDELTVFSAGDLEIILGGVSYSATCDFSSATTYAEVATEIQTKVQALGAPLDNATVVYDPLTTSFNFDTNGAADGTIEIESSTTNFVESLGWSLLAIFSDGVAAQTITEMISESASNNNNFGSITTLDQITLAETVDLARWNNSENVMYQYYPRCTLTEAPTWSADLIGFAGMGLIGYNPKETDVFPWIHPAAELAAINWDQTGAMKNFMYTQNDTINALITSTTQKNTFDALRLNYFGVTQEAGTNLTFFQNGILGGGISDPTQMGVYAGEQWLKAEAKAEFLNMFLALTILSADDEGRSIASQYIEAFKNKAIANGVISIGKVLTTTQKAYITQIIGNNEAYQDVQTQGCKYDTVVTQETVDGVTKYTMTYIFIYAKRDGINKIEGRHVLI